MPLLEFESGMAGLMGEGITTVTFYSGDPQAAIAFLKERLVQVAAANPWICGGVVREKQHGKIARLRFSQHTPPVEAVFNVDDVLQLSEDMDYAALGKAVTRSSAFVRAGRKLLNKPLPVSRLTVAPGGNSGSFAVIFSMSHMIANGGTYYSILNMLSSEGEISALSPVRKQEMYDKMPAHMGTAEFAYITGFRATMNARETSRIRTTWPL